MSLGDPVGENVIIHIIHISQMLSQWVLVLDVIFPAQSRGANRKEPAQVRNFTIAFLHFADDLLLLA